MADLVAMTRDDALRWLDKQLGSSVYVAVVLEKDNVAVLEDNGEVQQHSPEGSGWYGAGHAHFHVPELAKQIGHRRIDEKVQVDDDIVVEFPGGIVDDEIVVELAEGIVLLIITISNVSSGHV